MRGKNLPCASLIFQDILITNNLSFTGVAISDRDTKILLYFLGNFEHEGASGMAASGKGL